MQEDIRPNQGTALPTLPPSAIDQSSEVTPVNMQSVGVSPATKASVQTIASENQKKNNSYLWIIGGSVLLLIVGGVVYFLFLPTLI